VKANQDQWVWRCEILTHPKRIQETIFKDFAILLASEGFLFSVILDALDRIVLDMTIQIVDVCLSGLPLLPSQTS
jgi:hypothetical protein